MGYTWDNAGGLRQLSMEQTLIEDNRTDYDVGFLHGNVCF